MLNYRNSSHPPNHDVNQLVVSFVAVELLPSLQRLRSIRQMSVAIGRLDILLQRLVNILYAKAIK
jgi:hypothetical protein